MNVAANICKVAMGKFKERSSQNVLCRGIDSHCLLGSEEYVFVQL